MVRQRWMTLAVAVFVTLLLSETLARADAAIDKRKIIVQRAAMLGAFRGQQIAEATGDLILEADQIATGIIFFYDQPVKVGLSNIDWSGSAIKHQNWRTRLNCFGYLETLAAAWRKTHDERYPKAARAYIEDWMNHGGSYETGDALRPGDTTLDIARRLGNDEQTGWSGTLPAFLDSKAFDDAFLDRMLASISSQAAYLQHHLAGWGNWRIVQVDTLVFISLRFPFLPNAQEIFDAGIDEISKALPSQFLPDGVHIERTPGYHQWMTRIALDYYRLAKIFPQTRIPLDSARLARGQDYIAQSALSGINDFRSTLRDTDPAPALEKRRQVLQMLYPRKPVKLPPLEQVFPDAGQIYVRSAWKPKADYLSFDCSSWGGDHSHLSRLSLSFRSGGRLLVADPGSITYEASDPFGPYGKSTPAHSTLNINGGNQSEAAARVLRTEFTPDTVFLYGRYDGSYWTGNFTWGWTPARGTGSCGLHRRIIFWVRGEYLIVLDEMLTDPANIINNVWQMGPMDSWKTDPATFSWWSGNADTNLFLRMVSVPDRTEMKCFEGSKEPQAGWVGHNGRDGLPAPQILFSYPSVKYNAHPINSAVLLVPFKGDKIPDYRVVDVQGSMEKYYHTVVLRLPDGSQDLISWTRYLELPAKTLSGDHPVSTDAPFLWFRTDPRGRPVKTFVLDGSYVKLDGRKIFSSATQKAQLVKIPAH